jgi:hypothetical protein
MMDVSLSNSLVDLAARIRVEHDGARAAAKRGVEHAIAAGQLLIEAKAKLQHGQWTNWLQEHCGLPDRTARAYMRVAKHQKRLAAENGSVADLSLRAALEALTTHLPSDEPSAEERLALTSETLEFSEVGKEDFSGCHAAVRQSDKYPGFFDVACMSPLDDGSAVAVWTNRPASWSAVPSIIEMGTHGRLVPGRWICSPVPADVFDIWAGTREDREVSAAAFQAIVEKRITQ